MPSDQEMRDLALDFASKNVISYDQAYMWLTKAIFLLRDHENPLEEAGDLLFWALREARAAGFDLPLSPLDVIGQH